MVCSLTLAERRNANCQFSFSDSFMMSEEMQVELLAGVWVEGF